MKRVLLIMQESKCSKKCHSFVIITLAGPKQWSSGVSLTGKALSFLKNASASGNMTLECFRCREQMKSYSFKFLQATFIRLVY